MERRKPLGSRVEDDVGSGDASINVSFVSLESAGDGPALVEKGNKRSLIGPLRADQTSISQSGAPFPSPTSKIQADVCLAS